MQMRRWLGLVAVTPAFVLVFAAVFIIGDLVGLKDTPSTRLAAGVTAVVCGLIGWLLARWKPVPNAAWSLPAGVGAVLAVWPVFIRPVALSLAETMVVIAIWVAALTAVGAAVAAIARRTSSAAMVVAAVGAVVLVVVLPFLAVRLSVGAGTAPWDSAATWVQVGLSDDMLQPAARIASMVAVLVMIGTSYTLGYVLGLRRPDGVAAPAAAVPAVS